MILPERRMDLGGDAQERAPEARKCTLTLGSLRKPLAEQLAAQGLAFDEEAIRHLDLDAEAASRLRVRGFLSPAASQRAYDTIARRVWGEVRRSQKVAGK